MVPILDDLGRRRERGRPPASRDRRAGIIRGVTLVEITYELQSPLKPEQLRTLGEFANTYGLRRFHVNEEKRLLSFEYDASRLKETEVTHLLRQARIPVVGRVS